MPTGSGDWRGRCFTDSGGSTAGIESLIAVLVAGFVAGPVAAQRSTDVQCKAGNYGTLLRWRIR